MCAMEAERPEQRCTQAFAVPGPALTRCYHLLLTEVHCVSIHVSHGLQACVVLKIYP